MDALLHWGAKSGPLVTDAEQGWRLLTANLLHRDALHLGLNLLVFAGVGTAVERSCRWWDYVALLAVSGLATMAGSLWWSPTVSVGASGWVFGCVGALLVLGRRARTGAGKARLGWFSGENALPTVLVFLWLGWTSVGVDNAGHMGGLMAGLLVGVLLRSRAWGPGGFRAVALVGLAGLGAAVVVAERSRWRVEHDDGFGVAVSLPDGWRREEDGQERRAFSNGLKGLGRATLTAEAIEAGEPGDGSVQARHFLDASLVPGRAGPEGRTVSAGAVEPASLGGRPAQRIRAELDGVGGRTHLVAWFVPRGEWVYRLVFTWPQAYPAYARVVERMTADVRFEEPASLRVARARALLVPGVAGPLRELGHALRRWGLPADAVEPLASAVRLAPTQVDTRVELARAYFESGQVEAGCHSAAEARVYGPSDTGALEAGVRCALAQGDTAEALLRLEEARRVDPRNARLRAAEGALKAAVEAPGPAPQRR
ncbi:rhomboid family intramembrane serine protease [Corallococcus sp. AB011P]|uniref:rhomboid family protein n=2 Tax=unclassified Corallococcus TaxID=2685029 RepID=UPI001F264BF9|nr:rhomboid family intramembrane serine protease [Corallococcus sp. AB011P]